jgi:hypothetical protein
LNQAFTFWTQAQQCLGKFLFAGRANHHQFLGHTLQRGTHGADAVGLLLAVKRDAVSPDLPALNTPIPGLSSRECPGCG